MKKLLIILLIAGLVFVGAIALFQGRTPAEAPAATAEPIAIAATEAPAATVAPAEVWTGESTQTDAEEPESAGLRHVDLEALYALYPGDSVYATVGEREITWDEYYEWLGSTVLSAENYMETMAAYGMAVGWDSEYAAGVTMAKYVTATLSDNLRAYTGIDVFAEEHGVLISEEELAAKEAEDRSALLGADADDAAWAELLTANFMTERLYLAQAKATLELTRSLEEIYGENGEKLDEEALRRYIEDQGYLRCNHILFLTMDMDTYESLDEDTILAKREQAEKIAAELQAIEDRETLLARFAELKEELDEDSGKLYYPDGYIFTPGTMVSAFEDTTRELQDFEVSSPVLSEYGYHVILRLPIDADTVLDDGGTIGAAAASETLAAALDEVVDALDFSYAEGAEEVDLTQFLVEYADK